MRKKKTRFFASPFIMFLWIILLLVMLALWITVFIAFLQGGNDVTSKEEMRTVFMVVSLVFLLGSITFFGTCHKGFSVFEISEKGVKKSLFKVFRKTEISWDEMYEIRCYGMIDIWIFFSKTCLEGMLYNNIIKRQDILQIEYSKEIVELIRSFTDKEIINLPTKEVKNK